MRRNLAKRILKSLLFSTFIIISGLFLSCQSDEFDNVDFNFEDFNIIDSDFTDSIFGQAIKEISEAGEPILPKEEYEIGRSVAANILKTYSIYDEAPELTEYLNKICKVITLNSPLPYIYNDYCVAILDTDEITAMTTPGGHIFISKGMLKCAHSEDAVAAVLAHEIAHIQLKHSVRVIISNRQNSAVSKVTKREIGRLKNNLLSQDNYYFDMIGIDVVRFTEEVEELLDSSEKVIASLLTAGFSREQEFKADNEALLLMYDAGYDPDAMVEILQIIRKNRIENEGWDKTHPDPKDRMKNVKKSIKKNQQIYGYRSFSRKARIKRFQKNMEEIKKI